MRYVSSVSHGVIVPLDQVFLSYTVQPFSEYAISFDDEHNRFILSVKAFMVFTKLAHQFRGGDAIKISEHQLTVLEKTEFLLESELFIKAPEAKREEIKELTLKIASGKARLAGLSVGGSDTASVSSEDLREIMRRKRNVERREAMLHEFIQSQSGAVVVDALTIYEARREKWWDAQAADFVQTLIENDIRDLETPRDK